MEIVKIRMKSGRIVTLTITASTSTHIVGSDKFGVPTVLPLSEIDKMLPYRGNTI